MTSDEAYFLSVTGVLVVWLYYMKIVVELPVVGEVFFVNYDQENNYLNDV